MKFETEYGADGGFLLRAIPGEFDAVPMVDRLVLDWAPPEIEPSRLGLAAYLAFGEFSSGELHFAHPVGPELAAAIDIDTAPVRIRTHAINFAPKNRRLGQCTVVVGTEISFDKPGHRLAVISPNEARGFFKWRQSSVVCSNSSMVGTSWRALLAVAVLLADELRANEFILEQQVELSALELTKLQVLLQSVGLNLSD